MKTPLSLLFFCGVLPVAAESAPEPAAAVSLSAPSFEEAGSNRYHYYSRMTEGYALAIDFPVRWSNGDLVVRLHDEAFAEPIPKRWRERNVSQAAVVVADNRSGAVLVSVPAAFPESSRGGALNGTVTPRSAASTLKPFVYLMAFRHGAWPGTVLADIPTLYRSADGVQAPGNYNDQYLSLITIRQALACSQNIPAPETLERYMMLRGELY